jgi:hypothetical protein
VSKLEGEPNKGLARAPAVAGNIASASAPFAPGLTVTRIESLQLPACERAFLIPIAAIWEFEVGDDTPVTKLDVTNGASDRSEAVDD